MSEVQDLQSLFGTAERSFLVRNNGDEVEIDSLQGKTIALFFSTWCETESLQFTHVLKDVYNELSPQDSLEVVFCSDEYDGYDSPLYSYFNFMPWLAIPFPDQDTHDRLHALFQVDAKPRLVILDGDGKILNDSAAEMILKYKSEAYPFTKEKLEELEEHEAARKEQSLKSILASHSRDFVISADGNKVPISDLEGKVVGLFFADIDPASYGFTETLVKVYEKLRGKGESFEIVLVSLHYDEDWFNGLFASMPWLALPYDYAGCAKLARYFKTSTIPSLAIVGSDGQTLNSGSDVVGAIEEYGAAAYPFTPEKIGDLKKAKETQTVESLLVFEDNDSVIGKNGETVPVCDLVGKIILLYFSDLDGPLCLGLTYILAEAYEKIKAMDATCEIIFISSDKDQDSFEKHYSEMPWKALPYGDTRVARLSDRFNVTSTPRLISIGSNGLTIEENAQDVFSLYGAKAYPFRATPEREEGMVEEWPERVRHELHERHDLLLVRANEFDCEGCGEGGSVWAYECIFCGFYLHLKCAVKQKVDGENEEAHG